MATLIRKYAEEGNELAVVDDLRSRSWVELNARVNQLGRALLASGLRSGDHVALLCGNRCEFLELVLGCFHTGLVVVPINWHSVADEVAYALENSNARALVVEARFADVACAAVATLERRPLLIEIGPDDGEASDYEKLLGAQPDSEITDEAAGGVMFFTSGTTGRPKGVNAWYTRQPGGIMAISAMSQAVRGGLGVPPDAVTLLDGPAYHTAQFFWAFAATISGAPLVMRGTFDPAKTLEYIDRYAIGAAHFVPTQFVRFLRLPPDVRGRFDGSSLVCVVHGAAPCPPEVKRQMIEWWGPKLTEYYGGTEIGTSTVIDSTAWLARPGSVGRPVPTCRILIVRDDGTIAPTGEDGQIYVEDLLGRDFEYHGDADKTSGAHLAPSVATLGDVGHLDGDGFLYLSDRKADLIISGGVNIYPAEVEAVLISHPAVADVAVIGVPNDEFGEEVKAIVELVEGVSPAEGTAADLSMYCRSRLAGYKVPRSFDFEPSLPRHSSGKLYKRLLRDRYWRQMDRLI